LVQEYPLSLLMPSQRRHRYANANWAWDELDARIYDSELNWI